MCVEGCGYVGWGVLQGVDVWINAPSVVLISSPHPLPPHLPFPS